MPSSNASVITVLVVDDHPLLRDGVAFGLSGEPDMRIVANAHDGRSAIEAFREHRPDITLMDLQLPDMSGIEVMRRLRNEPSLAACRFVALSANAMPEDVEQALQAGFSEYWTKPLNLQQFLADMDALARNLCRA